MKWFWIIVLIIVGIVAAIFAVEYLTTSIYHLPTWVPGNEHGKLTPHGKPVRGHEYKRGYAAAVVAIGAFAWAGWMIYKMQKEGGTAGTGTSVSGTGASESAVSGPAES